MAGGFLRKITFPSKVSTYLSRTLIVITVATTLLIGSALIIQQTIHFNATNKKLSQEYLENQKDYIQGIVENELKYIEIQNELFKQNVSNKIKQNVFQAINTAETIYKQYAGKKSEEEIKFLITTVISSLKFKMEYEDVFISTLNGTGVYYPRQPEFSGKDLRSLKDATGSSVIIEELNLLKNNNEGFLSYHIGTNQSTKVAPHKKIVFVKKFGHFNWYFGSKQYLDDYFPEFRNEIAQKISSFRFEHGGYVFMNQTDGKPIVMHGEVYSGNMNLLSTENTINSQAFKKELDIASANPEGGFFTYQWTNSDNSTPSEKCSFVKLFKEYNWLIGAGFYLDKIDQIIKNQQKTLKKDQQKSIRYILLILLLLLALEAFIIYHFNKQYYSDFNRFFKFFYSSPHSFNKLNTSEFYFDEFKRAGIAANEMIMLREEIKKNLIEEQQKATESDRLKSAFLANMSHEIRTPMNAILGFSELLEDEDQDEEDKAVFVKLIRKNGDILLHLINDIIDISKIEANLLSIKKYPIKLNVFLDDISSHYTEIIATRKDKNIQFTVSKRLSNDMVINTDEARLRQILDNLIGNAIKFTSKGSISVEVEQMDKTLLFSVADTGIGIPQDQQETIFERFMQAHHDVHSFYGGTGLGLAISKNLVGLLGGSIHVKSEPGKGSTFYFELPVT